MFATWNLAFIFHKFKYEIYFCRHYRSSQFYLTDIMEMRNFIFILSDIALAPQKKSVNQRKKKEWPKEERDKVMCMIMKLYPSEGVSMVWANTMLTVSSPESHVHHEVKSVTSLWDQHDLIRWATGRPTDNDLTATTEWWGHSADHLISSQQARGVSSSCGIIVS